MKTMLPARVKLPTPGAVRTNHFVRPDRPSCRRGSAPRRKAGAFHGSLDSGVDGRVRGSFPPFDRARDRARTIGNALKLGIRVFEPSKATAGISSAFFFPVAHRAAGEVGFPGFDKLPELLQPGFCRLFKRRSPFFTMPV